MKYKLHTSPNSKGINHLIVIYPGMDDGVEAGTNKPTTSNNIEKYDIVGKITAELSEPGVTVITLEYLGPHEWGTPIDFIVLTDDIAQTLLDAVDNLKAKSFVGINIKKIDLVSHSYGFTALFWSLANNVFSRVIGKDCKGGTNLHLFEPYGISAMKAAKESSLAFREYEVVAAAQERFPDIASNENSAQAAQNELTKLRSFEDHSAVNSMNIILGLFRPSKSIHDSYGAINADEMGVNVIKLDKVGHGGAFLDILKAKQAKALPPDYALTGFQILMNALICSLRGIKPNDNTTIAKAAREAIQQRIVELSIRSQLMPRPDSSFATAFKYIRNNLPEFSRRNSVIATLAVTGIAVAASSLTQDNSTAPRFGL